VSRIGRRPASADADSPLPGNEAILRDQLWIREVVERLLQSGDETDVELIKRKLAELMSEHRDLDDVIARVTEAGPFDQLQIQRLKKRKLMLKDEIARLESRLLPDIIA